MRRRGAWGERERGGREGVVGREKRGSARFLFFRELSWTPPTAGAGSPLDTKLDLGLPGKRVLVMVQGVTLVQESY